jgi:outer membrane protein TolC
VFWELHPTRVIYAVKAANIALDQQSLNIRDLENRTVEETMRLYYQVLASQALAQSIESEVGARQEFLEITRRRYFLDMATGLDTLQARVQMMNLVPAQRRAFQDVRNAGRALNTQMGRDPGEPLALHVDFLLETDELDEDLAVELAMQRPDIQRALMQEDYLRKERDVLKSEMHPYLIANGSYGYVTREIEDLVDEGHDYWAAGLGLTIPIFDGFLTKGRIQERDASIRRTQFEVRGIRRRAEEEVRGAVGDLEIARENLQIALLNRDQAEKALGQTNRRYELGKAGYLDVLNAQSARFTARSNLIQAYYDVLVGTAVLKRSVGLNPTQPLAAIKEMTP